MAYVLVVITVITATGNVTSDTRFQEFDNRAACETAKVGIVNWMESFKGPYGRKVFVECYSKG